MMLSGRDAESLRVVLQVEGGYNVHKSAGGTTASLYSQSNMYSSPFQPISCKSFVRGGGGCIEDD